MIAFERLMIVTGSQPCTAFSQFQKVSWYQEREKWQATKLLHVAMDVYEEQIRAGRYFLHDRVTGVFTVSSPMFGFQAKVETKDGSRDVNKFVYKPTKWMTKSLKLWARDVQIATNHHFTDTSC